MKDFAQIVVDPDRVFFVIPYLNHPVTWYGLLFAFGFLIGYFIVRQIFTKELAVHMNIEEAKGIAAFLTDRLAMITVISTVIGARLGHVFFYDWPIYQEHPLDILKVWEGGLASHGAAMGILIGLMIFTLLHRKKYHLTFLATLDSVVVAAAFAGGAIRIGNFINQEILGMPTQLPWGIAFLHPLEGPAGVPLHPVQLYESFFYFFMFLFLWMLWKKGGQRVGSGLLTGLFFLLVFAFRFYIEFFKMPLSQMIPDRSFLNMGQLLSIPFIVLGGGLLVNYFIKKKRVL